MTPHSAAGLPFRRDVFSIPAMKLAVALALLAVTAHAELKWKTTSQRFTYEPGKPVFKTEFAFTNTGKSSIRILEVKSGCACCTSASVKKVAFAPGETAAVSVKINVRGKEVPIIKPVIVQTDDGKYTTLLVEVTTPDGQRVKVPRWGK